MRLLGVKAGALPRLGRRSGTAPPAAAAPQSPAPVDSAAFLGLSEIDLTPSVQGALSRLLGEIDELRGEVRRLKARLAEAEAFADKDALTPVLNRRAFVRELGRMSAFVARYGGHACLIYFDLDGLKAVNDRLGHAAGDAVLAAVAARLTAGVGESGLVGRIGGDEFGVILAHADVDAAGAKAAGLAAAVEAEPVAYGDWLIPLKISHGLRRITPGLAAEQILAAADRAMYARKRNA